MQDVEEGAEPSGVLHARQAAKPVLLQHIPWKLSGLVVTTVVQETLASRTLAA
jgi:hypothetical protein